MRRLGVLGIGLLAALALGATVASGALANTGLELSRGGAAVPENATVGLELDFGLGGCNNYYFKDGNGTLSVNGARRDTITSIHAQWVECEETAAGTDSISGSLTEVQLQSTGALKAIGSALRIHVFEGRLTCVYEFKKLAGTFPLPGVAVYSGTAVGKLDREESTKTERGQPGCAKTQSTSFRGEVYSYEEGVEGNPPMATELVG